MVFENLLKVVVSPTISMNLELPNLEFELTNFNSAQTDPESLTVITSY